MPLYEHVFLARQDLGPQQVEEFTNQYKAVIEGMGGKVAKTEYWGVKSLFRRARPECLRRPECVLRCLPARGTRSAGSTRVVRSGSRRRRGEDSAA